MKEQNIQKLLANGERATLECKKAQTCVPNSRWETYSAFAMNTYLMLNGILKVEKYDDRFVLTNPGLLKLRVEQIYAEGESIARNQRMQAMLRMIGYGENLGSGFPLILSAWNEKHWLKPELVEQPELMQVKLILHIEDIANSRKNDPKEVTDRQRDLLMEISEDNTLTREQLSQKLGVSESTIKQKLNLLKDKGYIERKVGKTYGKWIIKIGY
jgi:predicted HTH transcriptional regulator